MRRWFLLVVVGLLFGHVFQTRVEAQLTNLLFARDSVSGLPVVIQTDGANALKVVGQ